MSDLRLRLVRDEVVAMYLENNQDELRRQLFEV